MNPDPERRRLETLYSQMTEGELRKIALDASSLTDDALTELKAAIARQGFDIEVPLPAGTSEIEQRKLVTIREFRDLPEAELAKGLIESAGIECFFANENIVRMDWFYSNAVGGIKLQVNAEDAAAAIEILDQPIPENFEVEGVGGYQQPHCPKCQSMDVTFQELNEPVAFASAWVGLPMPVHRTAWKCKSCGVEWEDTETDKE